MKVNDFSHIDGYAKLNIQVTNTGGYKGKEVVQIYGVQPSGKLEKAKKVLVAYQKTKELAVGETQILELEIADKMLASYDDTGVTGFTDAFVLESGTYQLVIGNSVLADLLAGEFEFSETILIEQCQKACIEEENGSNILKERILQQLPEEIPTTGDKGLQLSDVKEGKCSMETFIAQLSDKELSDLTHGEGGMGSSLGPAGNAGAFGGITEELRAKGIPAVITADGPAGLRLRRFTTLLPNGTSIACTWNDELVE
ncbi:MAG: fibronectin type III-like domain-contianing protein [Lachnospiraceae bacterium]|nr:fibronectin type III-like domain-contianing protein [Lachnospiraceae bacterium]